MNNPMTTFLSMVSATILTSELNGLRFRSHKLLAIKYSHITFPGNFTEQIIAGSATAWPSFSFFSQPPLNHNTHWPL